MTQPEKTTGYAEPPSGVGYATGIDSCPCSGRVSQLEESLRLCQSRLDRLEEPAGKVEWEFLRDSQICTTTIIRLDGEEFHLVHTKPDNLRVRFRGLDGIMRDVSSEFPGIDLMDESAVVGAVQALRLKARGRGVSEENPESVEDPIEHRAEPIKSKKEPLEMRWKWSRVMEPPNSDDPTRWDTKIHAIPENGYLWVISRAEGENWTPPRLVR